LFVTQAKLEELVEKGEVTFVDNVLTLLKHNASYAMAPAAKVTSVLDGQDNLGLLNRVWTIAELTAKGAEHFHDSIIAGDTAYQCEPGFVGEQKVQAPPPAAEVAPRAPTFNLPPIKPPPAAMPFAPALPVQAAPPLQPTPPLQPAPVAAPAPAAIEVIDLVDEVPPPVPPPRVSAQPPPAPVRPVTGKQPPQQPPKRPATGRPSVPPPIPAKALTPPTLPPAAAPAPDAAAAVQPPAADGASDMDLLTNFLLNNL
jgi:hypothetical protein